MNSSNSIEKYKYLLQQLYPEINVIDGDVFAWSALHNTVATPKRSNNITDIWSLLHEYGHATLAHNNFQTDIELLMMEADAWEQAKIIALELKLQINKEYIQDTLDTYRDWLYKRSLCPYCEQTGVETTRGKYTCLNCDTKWKVKSAQTTRPYRKV